MKDELPGVIGCRTDELAPLLRKWRKQHPGVPWSRVLVRGLKKELEPYAGKRERHLLAA
jgi:hypothetical protein